MRLTIGQLRRIIRETVEEVVEEQEMAELEELDQGYDDDNRGADGNLYHTDRKDDDYSNRYGYGDSRGGGSYSTDSEGNYHGRSSGGGNQRGAAWD